ncbi:MAG: tRNA (adenosine(37)-N6)-threonylcarbamoyltransferase complex dimerization subunit type 1 TsaB [Gammaproteobacteria bacterium]|nr:tRNA (adenosine(37)-N6)-threonylcarbamoyltransferase complex dimerization subunit type 1 TsaB [Gammaproteobacteria bacterium]MBM4232358.1 tRNA (adenosine(37)-N6)-threonylcarbamoyltransferase complex dimerization subunit type 1 TsaB [Gammaproteobacteria bacterium]
MKILALDTSTEACSAALRVADRGFERYHEAPRGHAELILPMIDELLAEAGITLKDLNAIAFGRGPGSFTGVRLAASVVQGLAFGAGVGVVPVSTLKAVALRAVAGRAVAGRAVAAAAPQATHVLVCNDARMDEVYTAAFAMVGSELVALGPEQVLAPGLVQLPSVAGAHWIGAGRGFRAYPALGPLRLQALEEVFDDMLPHAVDILELAVPEVRAGRVLPPAAALPIYVRDEVAKVPRPVITLQQ